MNERESLVPGVELASLRKLYGAKFNAICAALGHVSEAKRLLEGDDTEGAGQQIEEAERILIDA